jgi:hypothetical protein
MAGKPMTRHDRIAWAFAFGLVLAMSCCPPALAQSMIGTAAAVKNDVHGVRGSAIRTLASGGNVFSDDLVKTGDASLAQLLFVDQTTITVAANSEALLKSVFHPKEGYKQLVLKTVVGAFRYVSGMQKPQHTEIEFPFGYLTVRGTIVDLLLSPTRAIIVLEEGAVTVVPYATGVHYNLDRPEPRGLCRRACRRPHDHGLHHHEDHRTGAIHVVRIDNLAKSATLSAN